MRELPLDHHCAWREEAEELRAQLGALRIEHQNAQTQLQNAQTELQTLRAEHETLKALVDKLQRHVFGQRSEKMPPMDREVRRGKPIDRAKVNSRRRANASAKRELVQRGIEHKVADHACAAQGQVQEALSVDLPRVGDDLRTRAEPDRISFQPIT